MTVFPVWALAQSAPGKHFILLIDDSGDAGAIRQADAMIPRLLFGGLGGHDAAVTRFDPKVDTLSVMFFALHKPANGQGCKTNPGLVVAVPQLFEPQPPTMAGSGCRPSPPT